MKNRHAKLVVAGILPSALCLASGTLPSRAEGFINFNGAYGVNRVIRTNPGYVAAAGTAAIYFSLPAEIIEDSLKVTPRVNPYNNKPSAYLGGTGVFVGGGTAECDVGIQYETGTYGGYRVGWAAFVSNSNAAAMPATDGRPTSGLQFSKYSAVKVWNEQHEVWEEWRAAEPHGPYNSQGYDFGARFETYMRYDMMVGGADDGTVRLTLSAFGRDSIPNPNDLPNTLFWNQSWNRTQDKYEFSNPTPGNALVDGHRISPWIGERIFNTSRRAEATAKRVVAMTRATQANTDYPEMRQGNFELDGSQMLCTFTNSQVAPVGSALRTWMEADVLQRAQQAENGVISEVGANDAANYGTGYDAPGHGPNGTVLHSAWDRLSSAGLVTNNSRTIVEFSRREPFDPNYNVASRAGVYDTGRYQNETVGINLKTATRAIGDPLE